MCAKQMNKKTIGTEKHISDSTCSDFFHNVISKSVFLNKKGDTKRAEMLLRNALKKKRGKRGSHGQCDAMHELGNLLEDKWDFDGAEKFYRQALAGYNKLFGPKHLYTFRAMGVLGFLLIGKGRYDEAEILVRSAAEGFESIGSVDYYLPWSIQTLGQLQRAKGDHDGAEILYRRALEGYEQGLGFEHLDTLASVDKLASLLSDKEESLVESVLLYRRAMEGYEKLFGTNNPKTLATMGSLIHYLINTSDESAGHDEELEVLCKRYVVAYEQTFGSHESYVLNQIENFGFRLLDKGKYGLAAVLFQISLLRYEEKNGPDHPDVFNRMLNIALVLTKKGNKDGAEALYRKALLSCEKVLGLDHPDTLSVVNNLACLLIEKGDYAKAEPFCKRGLDGRQTALGPEHPDTLASVNNLALVLAGTERLREAITLLRCYAVKSEMCLAMVCYNLACYECLTGNIEEAKRLIVHKIAVHPSLKITALADVDLAPIHDFIYLQ